MAVTYDKFGNPIGNTGDDVWGLSNHATYTRAQPSIELQGSSAVEGASPNYGTLPGFEGLHGGYTQYNPDGSTIAVPSNMPKPGMFNGMLAGVTTQGFSDVMGGLAAGYGIYSDREKNKMLKRQNALQNAANARAEARHNQFASNVTASGLGKMA